MLDRIDVERAGRMREIRDLRNEKQADFADELNRAAKFLKLSARYDPDEVSKRETVRKKFEVDDYLCLALLDPQKRGWSWVAFGVELDVGEDAWKRFQRR